MNIFSKEEVFQVAEMLYMLIFSCEIHKNLLWKKHYIKAKIFSSFYFSVSSSFIPTGHEALYIWTIENNTYLKRTYKQNSHMVHAHFTCFFFSLSHLMVIVEQNTFLIYTLICWAFACALCYNPGKKVYLCLAEAAVNIVSACVSPFLQYFTYTLRH